MVKALVAASLLWPALLAGGAYARIHDRAPWLAGTVYLAGSRICHQNPDRSFHTHGVKWPVCSRCSGFYLAAPFGALAAIVPGRRWQRARRDVVWLAVAATPTAIAFLVEHGGLAPVSSLGRCVAALPLGAAVAWVIVRAARGPAAGIG